VQPPLETLESPAREAACYVAGSWEPALTKESA
jgi:hypothetical protein